MTYGWAILIIAVVLGAFLQLGVFSNNKFGPSVCIPEPGFECSGAILSGTGALSLTFGQVSSGSITVTGLSCTNTDSVGKIYSVGGIGTIQSGDQRTITFYCPVSSSAVGTPFTGTLWIQYSTRARGGGQLSEIGRFSGSVQGTGSAGSVGNVWVADYNSGILTKLSSSGTTIGTYTYTNPRDIAIDANGNVWITEGSAVAEFSSSLTLLRTYYAPTTTEGLAIDANGNVWVTTYDTPNVLELSNSGTLIGTYADGSSGYGGIAIDANGNVWFANGFSASVTKLSSSGTLLGTYYPAPSSGPYGLAIDANGNVWVTNSGGGYVTKLSSSGVQIGTYTVGSGPEGIAIDANGNVWVADSGSGTVTELSSSGATIGTYTVGTNPEGIAIDANGNVWVADGSGVAELSSSGAILGTYNLVAGSGSYDVTLFGNGDF